RFSCVSPAGQVECRNTLRQLALSLHNYHDVYTSFPLGCVGDISLPPE
ncbi:MAG: DUF1559 domain-containing protein, partial [Planctomycetaceae bacterium]|nr:DUF1559 domain-containing protein [Planctomycetaceae bacterium]